MKYKVTEKSYLNSREVTVSEMNFVPRADAEKYAEYIIEQYKKEGFYLKEITLQRANETINISIEEAKSDHNN